MLFQVKAYNWQFVITSYSIHYTKLYDVSIIGCVVNGPGEAEASHLGLAGSNKKSAFYEDGVRQKERFDNDDLVAQLEAKIRAKAAMLDEKNRINIQQLEQVV